ncbi:shikimate dehydrogenase family protein [Spongiivirga citrea]|uniref:Shikimate dehydrogenase n=1 Tax=Spongiivirga citrea TaxID=1481457 RepID=A0A6M0CDW5_9FLAO|nr:shikimate dehydrogenase [Spongiivirga citrea]NER16005.1 shikimate dehydrogenase [Spongiivirga citrea]
MRFGLIGKNISYSFSQAYFSNKFKQLKLPANRYDNFDLEDIEALPQVLKDYPELKGLNVTIPYKESVIPFLNKLSKKAEKIGAVNTIKFLKNGGLKGYNTDCYGFKKSIEPFIKKHHKKALILGTGGASKAIAFSLKELGIKYKYVSRSPVKSNLSYDDLNEKIITQHQIIINCTPLGTFPKIDECPNIPYEYISENHLLYDLVYNPKRSLFLTNGEQRGAVITNGLKMLEFQAEKAWEIWNN